MLVLRGAALKRKGLAVVLVAAAMSVALTGASATAATSNKPKSGGKLTYSLSSEPGNMDPGTTGGGGAGTGTAGPYFQAVYDTLAEFNPFTGKVTPRLATSLTPSADGLKWTIKLRSGVKFSDGTDFDANAVKAEWDRINNPVLASQTRATLIGWTWAVADPSTFVVTLPAAQGNFPYLMTLALGTIPSPTAVAKYGSNYGSGAGTTVGAGSFTLQEWVRNDHMTLNKNPNYWDKPRPYLDTIVFKTILDSTQKADALRTGAIDLGFFSQGDPNTQALKTQGYQELVSTFPGAQGSQFNVSKPPFDDIRVRQAFILATNAVDVTNKATSGASPVASGKKGVAWYPKTSPYYDPSVAQAMPNLTKAQQLVDAYVAEKGPINVEMITPSITALTTMANAMAQQWNTLKNVHVTVNAQTPTAAISAYAQGNFLVNSTLTAPFAFPADAYPILYSTSPANVIHYKSAAMDQILTASRGDTAPAVVKKDMNKIAQQLITDALVDRVFFLQAHQVPSKKVGGLNTNPVTFAAFASVYDLWLKSS